MFFRRILLSFLLFLVCVNIHAQEERVRPKVGLVLSGGGAKGFAHIGAIRVLEEQGIPIDYIVGTSMGAIVGCFYAMGYSPDQIEDIILAQDWVNVLSDYVDRRYIPLYDRDEFDRYAFSLAINKHGVSLPQGVIAGQNIMKIISKYTIPFQGEEDFSKFPIPFACVAANIVDGKEVVLKKGHIVKALRASMAIPTAFAPVAIDGKLLIDGGMRNNLPVDVALKMGADVIIAVDLQEKNKEFDELGEMSSIFNQGLSFLGLPKYYANLKDIDVYIKPKLSNYSIVDFNSADSLIALGYQSAHKLKPQLDSLRDKIGLCRLIPQALVPLKSKDSLYIESISVSGLKSIDKSTVLGKFNVKPKSKTSLGDIENGINRLYASLGLRSAVYTFRGKSNEILHLDILEKNMNRFNVGVHYDSWNNAALLLNTTFNNIVGKSSKLSMDFKLANNWYVAGTYSYNRGWKPGVRLRVEYTGYDFIEMDDDRKKSEYGANAVRVDANMNTIISDAYSFGIGARTEYYNLDLTTGNGGLKKNHFLINYYSFLRMDTHEKISYPRTGMSLYSELRVMTDNGYNMTGGDPLMMLYFKMKIPIAICPSLTLVPYVYFNGAINRRDEDMFASKTYWGGAVETSYFYNQIPFVGVKEMGAAYKSAFVGRLDLQWEMWKNNYVLLKWNVGKSTDFLDYGGFIHGASAGFAYDSPIGPFEISPMWNSETGLGLLFNIGYWF